MVLLGEVLPVVRYGAVPWHEGRWAGAIGLTWSRPDDRVAML